MEGVEFTVQGWGIGDSLCFLLNLLSIHLSHVRGPHTDRCIGSERMNDSLQSQTTTSTHELEQAGVFYITDCPEPLMAQSIDNFNRYRVICKTILLRYYY